MLGMLPPPMMVTIISPFKDPSLGPSAGHGDCHGNSEPRSAVRLDSETRPVIGCLNIEIPWYSMIFNDIHMFSIDLSSLSLYSNGGILGSPLFGDKAMKRAGCPFATIPGNWENFSCNMWDKIPWLTHPTLKVEDVATRDVLYKLCKCFSLTVSQCFSCWLGFIGLVGEFVRWEEHSSRLRVGWEVSSTFPGMSLSRSHLEDVQACPEASVLPQGAADLCSFWREILFLGRGEYGPKTINPS